MLEKMLKTARVDAAEFSAKSIRGPLKPISWRRLARRNALPRTESTRSSLILSQGALLAICLLGTQTAWARTLYVDALNKAAIDTGPGTAELPMKTITKSVALVQKGDVVIVRSGVYRGERIVFQTDGSADAPIVLRADRGADVTIKGSVEVDSGWSSVGPGIYSHLLSGIAPYFPPAGQFVRGATLARNQVFVDGEYMPQVEPTSAPPPNSFCINAEHTALVLRLADGADPNTGKHHLEVSDTSGPLLNTQGHSYIRIEGLHFEHGANQPQGNALVQVVGGSHCAIDHCSVQYAAGAGITVHALNIGKDGMGHVVANSVFNHNGQEGIHASGLQDCQFVDNETSFNNTFPDKVVNPNWEAGGNKFSRTNGVSVIRHLSHDNFGSGIWFDVDNTNAIIADSTSYGNRIGIHYEISYTGTITGNISYSNRAIPGDGDSGIGIQISSSSGTMVYNNTAAWNDNFGIAVAGAARDDGAGHMDLPYSNDVENNIIANNGMKYGGQNFLMALGPIPAAPNTFIALRPNVSDYNLFWATAAGSFRGSVSLASAITGADLPGWRLKSGFDAHSKWGDPGFVGTSEKPDLHVSRDSPARDSGTILQQVQKSVPGLPERRQSRDIGAYGVRQ
jgi:hypothetical protein